MLDHIMGAWRLVLAIGLLPRFYWPKKINARNNLNAWYLFSFCFLPSLPVGVTKVAKVLKIKPHCIFQQSPRKKSISMLGMFRQSLWTVSFLWGHI